MQKRFSAHQVRRGRWKPGCQIVGSVTIDWLTTVADSQESHHASVWMKPCDAIEDIRRDALRWVVKDVIVHRPPQMSLTCLENHAMLRLVRDL